MTNVTTFDTSTGTVTIDKDLFQGYTSEVFEHMDTIAEAKLQLTLIYEALAEKSKVKESTLSKYMTQRYKAQTKATKELGELFGAIDEALSA